MKIRSILLAIPASFVAASAMAATFAGSYTVSYLSGPSHTLTATQCLDFTPTGTIVGFPNSGTWIATTFAGFGGNYVVDGSDVRFYGTFGSGTGVISHHATGPLKATLNGGFDDFAPTSGGASAANDGRITLSRGCTQADRHTHGTVSPTH